MPERPLLSHQFLPELVPLLDVFVDVANVVEAELELVLHAEVAPVRLDVLVLRLVLSDLFESLFYNFLVLVVAQLLVAVCLLLGLTLELLSILDPLKAIH